MGTSQCEKPPCRREILRWGKSESESTESATTSERAIWNESTNHDERANSFESARSASESDLWRAPSQESESNVQRVPMSLNESPEAESTIGNERVNLLERTKHVERATIL